MTTAINKLRSHFGNWREWELNPIVIKELRQGVRSWTVTGMLLLFLVLLFLVSVGFLITESFDISGNLELGGRMFSVFVAILAGASVFFIPLYTGVRVAAERQENNHDLLYVSTLSPTRIIFGKFLCSAYIVLLFFSACMPFMAFTNLLRGVDLPTVFFVLAFLFLVVCAVNMVAIFLACLPMSRPFKFLFVIYGILQSFGVIGSLMGLSFTFMRSGVGAMMAEPDFWIGTVTAAGIGLAVTGLFFVLSVALISPPSANRALPVRIYLTLFWLFGGLLALRWTWHSHDPERILVWTYPTLVLMVMALLATVSNSDQLSLRVRRTIPKSGWKRLIAFFFYNGAAGGLLWVGGIMLLTYVATLAIASAFPGTSAMPVTRPRMFITPGATIASALSGRSAMPEDTMMRFLTLTAYAFAYALTALFIQRKFLPRRAPKLTGLLAVLLAGGWAIAPSIFLFFANRLSWKSVDGLQLGNIFNVYFNRDNSQLIYHQYFAGGWLLVAMVLNAGWFLRQLRYFQPLDGAGQPAAAAGVPPVIPK